MKPSSTIQSRVAPRTGRAALPSNPPALSSEEETVAEIRCQKSDVAMDALQTDYEKPRHKADSELRRTVDRGIFSCRSRLQTHPALERAAALPSAMN
ncbi:MAG TPA: hypothetical protein VGS10_07300 [Terracidiphilus sp.]|nr:hypothetical protein [Terracidiphilus sp.]